MNNLCELVLANGGSVNYLMLPAKITEGLGLTNPSVFYIDNKYILNLRHVQYALYHSEGSQQYQTMWGPLSYLNPENDPSLRTTNYLCELDSNNLSIEKYKKVDTDKLDGFPVWEFIGLEDARIVSWDNDLYLTGVRRDTKPDGEGRMELSKIDKSTKEVERYRIEPSEYSYCEKNWMPILDMPFHYVKWTSPTEIVSVDPKEGTSATVKIVEQDITFPRDIRGGSQVITYGDYYVALTHEVDLWYNERSHKDAQYYHRFIVWNKDWKIVYYSQEFKFLTANIEFSCGLAYDGNNFIIPFGFQDSTAFILRMPTSLFETLCSISSDNKTTVTRETTPYKLEQFIKSPFDGSCSFALGDYYFENGHYASALSFYLRTAEFSNDSNLVYESLLMVALSLQRIKNRRTTELGLWLNALSFKPDRPEAYLFLSEYYEQHKNYVQAYAFSVMGLQYIDNVVETNSNIEYFSRYQLDFQRAVAAWKIGKIREAKDIFLSLTDKTNELPKKYVFALKNNLELLNFKNIL